jgi:hypothetical protein
VSQEQDTLWMIKGIIGDLPEDRRHKIMESYIKMKIIMDEYGDEGQIAVALLGAESAAKE